MCLRYRPRQILETTLVMERSLAVTVNIPGSAVKPPGVQNPYSPGVELSKETHKPMRTLVGSLETLIFFGAVRDPR